MYRGKTGISIMALAMAAAMVAGTVAFAQSELPGALPPESSEAIVLPAAPPEEKELDKTHVEPEPLPEPAPAPQILEEQAQITDASPEAYVTQDSELSTGTVFLIGAAIAAAVTAVGLLGGRRRSGNSKQL